MRERGKVKLNALAMSAHVMKICLDRSSKVRWPTSPQVFPKVESLKKKTFGKLLANTSGGERVIVLLHLNLWMSALGFSIFEFTINFGSGPS